MLVTSNYNNMKNKKTNPKLRVDQHLFLVDIYYYLKILLIYSKLLSKESSLLWQKNRNAKI